MIVQTWIISTKLCVVWPILPPHPPPSIRVSFKINKLSKFPDQYKRKRKKIDRGEIRRKSVTAKAHKYIDKDVGNMTGFIPRIISRNKMKKVLPPMAQNPFVFPYSSF